MVLLKGVHFWSKGGVSEHESKNGKEKSHRERKDAHLGAKMKLISVEGSKSPIKSQVRVKKEVWGREISSEKNPCVPPKGKKESIGQKKREGA